MTGWTIETKERLSALCMGRAEYSKGTAYVRTKILCTVLTELGIDVPGWPNLREIIGFGSSGDINRGKHDFRAEHAARLMRLSVSVNGVPPHVVDQFRAMWEESLAQASTSFDAERAGFKHQIEELQGHLIRCDKEEARLREMCARLQAEVADRQRRLADALSELTAESARRHEAERLFKDELARASSERERLNQLLADELRLPNTNRSHRQRS